MKRLANASFVVLLLAFSSVSPAADSGDRPAGVAPDSWVPISDRVGIVLVQGKSPVSKVPNQALLLKPPVDGYFMVKDGSGWTRLLVIEPAKGPADVG